MNRGGNVRSPWVVRGGQRCSANLNSPDLIQFDPWHDRCRDWKEQASGVCRHRHQHDYESSMSEMSAHGRAICPEILITVDKVGRNSQILLSFCKLGHPRSGVSTSPGST